MKNKNTILRGLTLNGLLASLLMGAAAAAPADQFGIQVAAGLGDHHVKKFDLGVAWDPNWTWWQIGDWHFALIGEAHVAWWHTNEGNVHGDIGEIGVTPVIRFIKASGLVRPFVEVGAGIRLLTSPTISSDFSLGTAFQFADMAGVGVQFGEHQQYLAGYRFQHISNGGIKEPNPGINFSQLYLQYNF
ncbi:acyloxyacyl hydrolase [Paraburkholderia susongensis]|uniref:Lipid A deacylase n=1 Tax=Paraburkholderia susongensis TaxID=1515439 RepID=A0A1X7JV95_9BURK|nr:acyloxyacyl hydrolase [Paraburkholderia susongensis]SMG32034.1 lipid A 3-O-deacylase [Paraburkholderia susongensis]